MTMWRQWEILCFLLLFGQCLGLQNDIEYQYRYSGRLAAGIPGIRHQYAAVSIQADVILQLENIDNLIFQLDNVRTGDFHDVVEECDVRSPLPIEDHPIEEGADFMHQPFRISMNETWGEYDLVLQVSKDEPLWITNIKKAIFNVFPFLAIRREMKLHSGQRFLRPYFGERDELIGGNCLNWYSVTKVPEAQAAREEIHRQKVIEEDVQHDGPASARSKSVGGSAKGRGRKTGKSSKTSPSAPQRCSVPEIDNTLWNVIRMVNYKMCEGNGEIIRINAPTESDKITSRSSTANFLIRGNQHGFRVERAVVEGVTSVFTSNELEDHIDTLTNQTLELRAVRCIGEKLTINFETKTVRNFNFELDKRSKEDGSVLSLEETLTGLHLSADDIGKIRDTVTSYLGEMTSDPKNVASMKKKIGEAFTYLTYDQLSELYGEISTEIELEEDYEAKELTMDILHMCLLSSGSESALRLLFEKAKYIFLRIDNMLSGAIFRNMKTVIKDPAILPLIVETAIGLRWDSFGVQLKSIALTETASLIHKLCVCAEKGSAYVDPHCKATQRCEKEEILQEFLTYIEQELSNTTRHHKAVLLQALSNLRTPMTLKILLPYILGTVPAEEDLRTTAIMSLSATLMPNIAMNTVYNTLMPIIENHGEEPTVRSMAFLVMMSWNPGPSWWSHIAAATWNDPSSQVANFISSTIRAVAESNHTMAPVASKVVHLTRPTPPFSLTRPFAKFIENYIQCEDVPREISLLWYSSEEAILPAYSTLSFNIPTLYGFPSTVKIDLKQQRLFQFLDRYFRLGPLIFDYDVDENQPLVEEMTREKIGDLGFELTKAYWDGVFRMTVHDILMYNYDYQAYHYPTHLPDDFLRTFPGMYSFPYQYENVDSTRVYPTDLGLPLVIRHLDITGFRKEHDTHRNSPEFYDLRMNINLDLHYQVSRLSSVEMTTLVPWSPKFAIGSGITNEMNLELPVNLEIGKHISLQQYLLHLKPLYEGKRDVIYSSNQPFTVTYGGFPLKTRSIRDYKVIENAIDLYKDKRQVFYASGYWFEHSWESDKFAEPPSFLDIVKGTSGIPPLHPSHCYWDYRVTLDPSKSRNKQLKFMFTLASVEGQIPSSDAYDYQEGQQESQGGEDFSDYSQFSQSASMDYSDFSQVRGGSEDIPMEEAGEDSSGLKEEYNRASKLHEELKITVGNHKVISASVKLVEEAKTHRASVLLGDYDDLRHKTSRSSLVAVFEESEGELQSPVRKSCYRFGLSSPNFNPFHPIESLISSTLSVDVNAEVNFDLTCSEPSAKLTGTFDIPRDLRQKMRDEILKECDGSGAGEHVAEAMGRLKYLKGQANVTWEAGFNPTWSAWASRRIYRYINDQKLLIDTIYEPLDDHSGAIYYDRPNLQQYSVLDHILPAPRYHSPFLSSYCLLDSEKVHTFDGAKYPLEADSCWRVALLNKHYGELMVLVREGETWEAQVLHATVGLHFAIVGGKVSVNGEPPKLDHKFYKVTNYPGSSQVRVLDILTIAVSNKVEIQIAPKMRNAVVGLCGDFDGEVESDLVGPKGCVFHDPQLFADSWSVPGDGCNAFTHRGKMRKVEEYREGCPTASHVSAGNSTDYTVVVSLCTGWKYRSKTEGPYQCMSEDPTPFCEPGCEPAYVVQKPMAYTCKKTELEEEDDVTCHNRSFVTHFPGECIPVKK